MIEILLGFNGQVMIEEVVIIGIKLQGRVHFVERSEVEPLRTEGVDHS